MTRPRAVFLDAGHTMLYAHPGLGEIYAETTAELGLRLPPEAFVKAFRPAFRRYALDHAGDTTSSDAQDREMWYEITRSIYDMLPGSGALDFDAWFEALYVRFGDPKVWRLYDDVEPALVELRGAGYRLGIVSNWDSRLRGICIGLGLDRLLDFMVISAEAGVRKPDARIFREALRQAGARPDEAVHVGDLPDEDVRGAREAGLRAVLLDRGVHLAPGDRPADVPILTSLAELPALLARS